MSYFFFSRFENSWQTRLNLSKRWTAFGKVRHKEDWERREEAQPTPQNTEKGPQAKKSEAAFENWNTITFLRGLSPQPLSPKCTGTLSPSLLSMSPPRFLSLLLLLRSPPPLLSFFSFNNFSNFAQFVPVKIERIRMFHDNGFSFTW